MKIRLHSPALVSRFGETADLPERQARAYIRAGVATELAAPKKKTTESKAKKKAETTSK